MARHCYTTTIVQTSKMPHFLFWNEYYRFALNSKSYQPEEIEELNNHEEDKELVAIT